MDPIWLNSQNITETSVNTSLSNREKLEALDPPWRSFLICLYSITSFLAFSGNIIVIIVEIFGKRSAKNLRKFLINLAISDILVGVFSVPFVYTDFMLGRWIFPLWLCPFAQFVQIISVFVTAFTLTVIGIERYFAILCPLSNQNQWFIGRCYIVLAVGWIFGAILGHIAMIHTEAAPFQWNNKTYFDCRAAEMEGFVDKIYTTSCFIFTFALPLIIQTFTYGSIGRKLLRDNINNNTIPLRRNSGPDADKSKIIRMLIAVVIVFGICWLPIKTFMLLMAFWPEMTEVDDNTKYYTFVGGYFFCHWLAMANSFVNPIIYSFMSKSFRADFKDVFLGFWSHRLNSSQRMTTISSTRIHTEKTFVHF